MYVENKMSESNMYKYIKYTMYKYTSIQIYNVQICQIFGQIYLCMWRIRGLGTICTARTTVTASTISPQNLLILKHKSLTGAISAISISLSATSAQNLIILKQKSLTEA